MLKDDPSNEVLVVREAMANIEELVDRVALSFPNADVKTLRFEAHETVLALMAHLITADGIYHPQEQAFLRQLVDFGQKPNAEAGFLRQYTEHWRQMETQVPEFFRIAVGSDIKHKTDAARDIMREIQLIANNCSVSDRQHAVSEKKVVQRYLRFLDAYIERETGGKGAWLEL